MVFEFHFQKYAALLEKEKVGAAELPYVGEDKLRALGVPLGPRMRILKEAGIHQELHHLSRDDPHNTTTTLAIVWIIILDLNDKLRVGIMILGLTGTITITTSLLVNY